MIYLSQPLEELGITEKLVKRVGVRAKNESQDLSISKCKMKNEKKKSSKAVLLHALEALGGRGGIAPTHSRPLH
jgi:hypothetical protein